MKKIIMTGGGTAGHVTPNIAMIPTLQELGYEIHYIGSHEGIEKRLIEEIGIPYYPISSGKLRRYFDLKNITDPFRVIHGLDEAVRIIKKINPDVIFSKGGFVSVPVVIAGSTQKVPIIIHESDMTPGLANKIALPRATKVCCNFPETKDTFPEGRAIVTGTPIRQELFQGDKNAAKMYCGFEDDLPTLMIIGGSIGSAKINESVRSCLDKILGDFNVIHICGKNKTDAAFEGKRGYVQYEYVKSELKDMFALADVVISRAGANAICELHALKKPNILIPLSKEASRGDQILNANSFEKSGYSKVIQEEDLTDEVLLAAINEVYNNRETYIKNMEQGNESDAITMIVGLIEELANK